MALIAVIAMVTSCGSASSDDKFYSDSIAYNDSIVDLQTRIGQGILDLSETFETADPAKMNAEYDQLKITISAVRAEAKSIKGFEESSELIDAARGLFDFYDDICTNEYREIIDMLSKAAEDITEEDLTRMDELANGISDREIRLDDAFEKAQNNFAQAHDFKLQGNDLQEQINELGE